MNTPVGSVYVVTNTVTNEQYIGLTRKTVQKRWDAHKRTAKCKKSKHYKLHIALQQFGEKAFVVFEIFVAFDNKALCDAEIQLIAEYLPKYNSSLGGSGLRQKVFTDEYRKKRSDAAKARWANLEWRDKTIAALKSAHNTAEAKNRGRSLQAYKGAEKRWLGHIKKPKPIGDKSRSIKKSWEHQDVRQARIAGLKAALAKPEVKAKYIEAATGRVMPKEAVEKSARSKWKPLYCPEIQVTFLCGKYAAEYFGVLRTSVSNAVKQKGKLLRKYSLEMVA